MWFKKKKLSHAHNFSHNNIPNMGNNSYEGFGAL